MNGFDVIVVGGGHAGVEAATAAARCGARTGLVTFDKSRIGAMSCNPAIGGVGKGHIVREVDAFDGIIAKGADAAGVHYRMLNRSKGTAVHGPRVQADRRRFACAVQGFVKRQEGLTVISGEVAQLEECGGRIVGVTMSDGFRITARAVVLATGTFLGGRMYCGEDQFDGGRVGEPAASRLAQQLRSVDLPMARLKTGTPPRLDGRTIDWAQLAIQPSDAEPWTMSPVSIGRTLPQLHCAITRTNETTHDIIRSGLDRSPLFGGSIAGVGPRYCPSIEDKVHRFGDRDGHQIFLEPEGLDDHIVYPNGISTSLPVDIQQAMIASIPGLEDARIVTAGYAVEYDHIDPRALDATLQVRTLPGLFCCGQINGTTGYEEAAGQGLVAGLNAAAMALDRDAIILDRASSYLGVMIDDLVLQGITEPYRMLTARAEYRLRLRADNAETRLGAIAASVGCLSEARLERLERNREARIEIEQCFGETFAIANWTNSDEVPTISHRSLGEWLRVQGVEVETIAPHLKARFDPALVAEVVEDARYAPYLLRQDAEIAEMRRDERVRVPSSFDYHHVPGLSSEMIERLETARPASLGAASRVRGVTPAALSAILLQLRRRAA